MTASEIISRSIAMHPSLFREALIRQADMHDDYARVSQHNRRAQQGAESSRAACLRAYDAVGAEDVDAILADCGTMVIALNVAGKLQCLPRHTISQAAVDWQESQEQTS